MTVEKLYNDFKYLSEIALTIQPYASDFTTYTSSNKKNLASVRVYRSSSSYRSVKFMGYGNTVEFDFHDTPEVSVRRGNHKLLKKLHGDCEKLIHENVEQQKSLEEAEQLEAKERRRKELEAELAELN